MKDVQFAISHLRFGFSFFLMPVFFFALSQAESIHWPEVLICFIILHVLIYPSSNGYNSYMDQDKGSIGGLENPPPAPCLLLYASLLMDALGVSLCFFISREAGLLIFLYIMASRAYSFRKIRLKKYPVLGFLTVIIFQGTVVFMISMVAATGYTLADLLKDTSVVYGMLTASLMIGAGYPISQIYQHQQDQEDGVITLSALLGYKGTFVFSGILLLFASILLFYLLHERHESVLFLLFLFLCSPLIAYFVIWFMKVLRQEHHANYKNTMRMNLLSATCLNSFFVIMIIFRHIDL